MREINSIGMISHGGRQLLIVVMLCGHLSESDVIQVVQAALAVSAVACFQRPGPDSSRKPCPGVSAQPARRRGSHAAG
jgi:hypothetical protein